MASIKKVGTTGGVNGVKITQDNTQEVLNALHLAVERVMTMIGIKVEAYAKKLCPVGTPESVGRKNKKTGKVYPRKGYRGGTLRNSITFEVQSNGTEATVVVGSNVEYAPYVELGTGPNFVPPPDWEQFDAPKGTGISGGYVKSRPFLRPAIEDHLELYKKMIKDELSNA